MKSRRVQQKEAQARRKMNKRAQSKIKKCPATGKRGYPNQNAALDAIASSREKAGQRAYMCDEKGCGMWHLTSNRFKRRDRY